GYNEITLELNTCFLYRRYGLNIARKSSLHVDQPAAVDPIVLNDLLLRVVEVIHMSAKHERCAAAGSLQRSDDIGSALLDFLVLDLHSQFFELAAQILCDLLLFARYTDDISHVSGKLNNPLPIHLFKHLLLHPLSSQPIVK